MSNLGSKTEVVKTNFASRLLNKELNNRKKTSQPMPVPATLEVAGSEQKERVLVGRP